jgi:hypothetical protein
MEVEFFVDEDPSRIRAKHLGIPIISPDDAAEGSDVFVGMAPAVSKRLAGKYRDAVRVFTWSNRSTPCDSRRRN